MAARKISPNAALASEISGDNYLTTELLGEPYLLKKKFPRLKFLRLLTEDPAAALALVFAPGQFGRLEETDMDEDDFMSVLESVSGSLVGGPKN